MKKGAIVIDDIAGAILVIIVIIVLMFITDTYKFILNFFAKDTVCEASFIASAISRGALNFGNPIIDPTCSVNKYTIVNTQKEGIENQYVLQQDYPITLTDQDWDTYLRVKKWNSNQQHPEEVKFSYIDDYSKEIFSNGERINIENPTKEQREYVKARYNMDKLFADELKRCWDIVGEGELPLFDNWYSFIDCKKDAGGVNKCTSLKDWATLAFNGKIKPSASFCVLCARIKFDEEVKNKFQGVDKGKYKSLARWMGNYPKRVGDKQSYYEYIYNPEYFFLSAYPEYSTDRAYGIVFARVNVNRKAVAGGAVVGGAAAAIATIASGGTLGLALGAGATGLAATGGIGLVLQNQQEKDIYYTNRLMVIPYEDISKECDYLVASEI